MGQKVNPVGLRLGVNRTWDSRWFAEGQSYSRLLHDDIRLRRALKKLHWSVAKPPPPRSAG